MHRTIDREKDSSIEREEEEVDKDRCVRHITIDRERGGGGRHR